MLLTKKLTDLKRFYDCLDSYIILGKYSLAKKTLDYFRTTIPEDRYNHYNSMLIKKLAERSKGIQILPSPKKVIRTRGVPKVIFVGEDD